MSTEIVYEGIDRHELARLRAIETRVRLLLLNHGNWAPEKVNACVADLHQLVHGTSAQDVGRNPAACTLARLHEIIRGTA